MKKCSMSRSRWEAIRSAMHFSDSDPDSSEENLESRSVQLHSNKDPFHKLRPLMELLSNLN